MKKAMILVVVLVAAVTVQAAYEAVVPWSIIETAVSDHMGGALLPNSYSKAIADGSTVYAEVRSSNPSYTWWVKVTDAGTPDAAASVLSEYPGNLTTGNSLGISGDNLMIIGGIPDEVWTISKTDGTQAVYLSKTQMQDQVGGDAVTSGYTTVSPSGEAVFYETDLDQIVQTNGMGVASVLISNQLMNDVMGSAGVQGQLAYDDSGNLYLGNTTTDSVWKFDGTNLTQIFSKEDIIALTGESTAGIASQVYNPADGLIYISENSSRDVLSFDPTDPSGTLKVFMTREDLENGALGTAIVAGFSIFNGELAATAYNQGSMAYCTIPEPTTLGLMVLGGLGLLKRRNAK